ncbi:MAG TPA: hypothetical protein VKB27_08890 [Gammaproteobacteria bacterium]|nr:hypothetical protein [Gammaproteobacteria bacterium]
MPGNGKLNSLILDLSLVIGLSSLGYLLGAAAIKFKEYERTVTVKAASQGQFSISDRDKNNPNIKKVRVVSTVVYYLSDQGFRVVETAWHQI